MSVIQLARHELYKPFSTLVVAKEGRVDFKSWMWPSRAMIGRDEPADVTIAVYDAPVENITVKIFPESFPAPFKVFVPAYGWKTIDTHRPTIIYTTGRQSPGFTKTVITKVRFEKEGTYRGEVIIEWTTSLSGEKHHKSMKFGVSSSEEETTTFTESTSFTTSTVLETEEGESITDKVLTYLNKYWYIPTAVGIGTICYFVGRKLKK